MYVSNFRKRVAAFLNAEVQVFCQVLFLGVLYIYIYMCDGGYGMDTAVSLITSLLQNDARTACYRIISVPYSIICVIRFICAG